jgi:Asp-tRNA(Asn)/Glu-tRNA(Gln) amidotransferase A subunit family amidase
MTGAVPELFDGTPVAVQLVGLPLMEEELLDVAAMVDKVVHDSTRSL